MLKLTQLAKYLMTRSGQYMTGFGTLADLNISLERLWFLVQPELQRYQDRIPLEKKFEIDNTGTTGAYSFVDDPNNTNLITQMQLPTLVSNPTGGSTSRSYIVAALDKNGVPIGVTQTITTDTAPAILDSGNSITLTWNPFGTAASYSVYRVTGTPGGGFIGNTTGTTFTDQGNAAVYGQIPLFNRGNTPIMISEAIPLDVFGNILGAAAATLYANMAGGAVGGFSGIGQPGHLVQNEAILYPYNADLGLLIISTAGRFSITAYYPYTVYEVYDTNKDLLEVMMPELDLSKEKFLDLVYARFLEIVGLQLSSFEYPELNIKTNGNYMVKRGGELYDQAFKNLSNAMNFWDAINT